jgi:hypothetical protein
VILEEATKEAFGYYAKDLSRGSDKPVLATCELCGEFRVLTKNNYHTFCRSCAKKGNQYTFGYKHTDKAKALMSAAQKGNINGLGYKHTDKAKARIGAAQKGKEIAEKTRALLSAAQKGKYMGKTRWNYNGGKKLSNARSHAKRKQQLGYKLLMPIEDGEVGHHVTDEYVIGVPEETHKQFCGYSRKKHRTRIFEWLKVNDKKKFSLVYIVLLNEKNSIKTERRLKK